MRQWSLVTIGLVVVGCSDAPPPTATLAAEPVLASLQSELAPPTVFNTQLRSELEVPACASESKGHAQIKILEDGTIDATAILNNKGAESVRFGHIHHLNPGAATGPIIWWLTSPIGTDLNLTDRHLDFRQAGAFVTNPHFTTHEDALAELRANPGDFYVNFHSDACPGGFARGFLP
jgi:hypothetical protein